jgi:hypothetical protein
VTKLVLVDVANLENENTAVAQMAANNAATKTAMENTVSLDGTLPNTMTGNLDFSGGGRIINLPTPSSVTEPARIQDLNNLVGGVYSGQIINGDTNISAVTVGNVTGLSLSTTPALGIPSAIDLTNGVNLPLASILGLGTNVAAFLATPNSANLLAAVTDETGTGKLVFSTSPTLVTPVLGVATATTINGSVIAPGAYTGTSTNDSAPTGGIGESITAAILPASPTTLTTATTTNLTSVTLSAGDWDVEAVAGFIPTSTTSITQLLATISNANNTVSIDPGLTGEFHTAANVMGVPTLGITVNTARSRLSISTSTTFFLNVFTAFTVSTLKAFGSIRARRVR